MMTMPTPTPPPRDPPPRNTEPPYATVRKTGRWRWAVIIRHGMIQHGPDGGPWTVHGTRNRAMRKAHRELERYRRDQQRKGEEMIVR
jgi:hypothetical protein